jgi:hypothetical protein
MAAILHPGKTPMYPDGNRFRDAESGVPAFAALPSTLFERKYAGLVLKQLAYRIGTEVPAVRKFNGAVMALGDWRRLLPAPRWVLGSCLMGCRKSVV